ncbi:TcpQ domain-containing protein [Pseudomonas sp. GOM7]|uniref:PFGI-1 class ICE element type IV pilus protein PilL2 n=1 Tax=Pseudomonas sp. GOM7 TaxID=2998079 RepID=UPI00227BD3A7|nr:TcpQ domain-containing protein [Pseudomonas sp. GOM7]WAJ37247.1 TcpQ domain-containing protein [Pseudomonas sp. GOM7]
MRHIMLLAMALVAVAGCALQRQPAPAEPAEAISNPTFIAPDIYADKGAMNPGRERDQVRSGRYTLTSTLPLLSQEDLMSQIIEVTIPGTLNPTVGDALKHALARSGYSLTAPNNVTEVLYSRPLPAAHYKLGPMKLRDTLQVLAGPAWRVQVDEVTRHVQFSLRSGYQVPAQQTAAIAKVEPATLQEPAPVLSSESFPVTPHSATSVASAEQKPVEIAKDGATAPVRGAPATAMKASTSASASAPMHAGVSKPPLPITSSTVVPQVREIWVADAGSTLRDSVEAWAKKAGWKVIWDQDDLNYPIAAALRFEGSFKDAIYQLFPLYDNAPRPFIVDGSSVQKIVHIAERKKK